MLVGIRKSAKNRWSKKMFTQIFKFWGKFVFPILVEVSVLNIYQSFFFFYNKIQKENSNVNESKIPGIRPICWIDQEHC